MKKIYTWAAQPANRTLTVDDLKKAKGKKKFTQVTANTIDEAEAAEKAGFDMIICNAFNVKQVREGSKNLFLTAALVLNKFVTSEDIMRGAFEALENGADAVMTPRSMKIIEMLANEDVPVMGHLGLVPRKSTWVGGLRAVGKNSEEATYMQPVTRGDIEDIRGVNVATNVIKLLLDQGWIKIKGYRDVPGRPALFITTQKFLDDFAMKTLSDLPELPDLPEIESITPELSLQNEPAEQEAPKS